MAILDGKPLCADESDEKPVFFKGRNCSEKSYTCDSGQCLDLRHVCDGFTLEFNENYGCLDGSDELHCNDWDCLPNYWKCASNDKCIRDYAVCDGGINCRDKSDEHNQLCGYCKGEEEWPCLDGDGCADRINVCNGEADCNDGSDEFDSVCVQWNCSVNQWKCKVSMKCIDSTHVCDTFGDCANGTDEHECEEWVCANSWWKCQDNWQCIDRAYVCDRDFDCWDFSDESSDVCVNFQCVDGNSKCADNVQCISNKHICDGDIDCSDGSDELCHSPCLQTIGLLGQKSIMRKCPENSEICYPVDQYCDGEIDCPTGTDETESGCKCEDWGLVTCYIDGRELCVYKQWVQSSATSPMLCDEAVHDDFEQSSISTNGKQKGKKKQQKCCCNSRCLLAVFLLTSFRDVM